MEENNIQKQIDESIDKVTAFYYKKIGDTPTDAFQLTPKKYVDSVLSAGLSSLASLIPTVNASLIAYSSYSVAGVWTKPSVSSDSSLVYVQLFGGGGGGGGGAAVIGGGGGGGGFVDQWYKISDLPSSVAAVPASRGLASSVGGTTYWNSVLTAYGGGAGGFDTIDAAGGGGGGSFQSGQNASGSTGGNGGGPGGAVYGVSSDEFSGAGNSGGNRGGFGTTGGGGGGAGGNTVGNGGGSFKGGGGGGGGNNGGPGGIGGLSYLTTASGGTGGSVNQVGGAGQFPASGGGGGASTHVSSVRAGGPGADGLIRVFTFI